MGFKRAITSIIESRIWNRKLVLHACFSLSHSWLNKNMDTKDEHCWCWSGCEARSEMGEGQSTARSNAGGMGYCGAWLNSLELQYSIRLHGWRVIAQAFLMHPWVKGFRLSQITLQALNFEFATLWRVWHSHSDSKCAICDLAHPFRCQSACKCSTLIVATICHKQVLNGFYV